MTDDQQAQVRLQPDQALDLRRPDPRRNAYRADLADARLSSTLDARRFSDGELFRVVVPSVPVRRKPGTTEAIDTEALFGESVRVFDTADRWAWVQLEQDGYVGYVPLAALKALGEGSKAATHKVRALGTFLYPSPDMKRPPLDHVSIGAQVRVIEDSERFARIEGHDAEAECPWVIRRHLAEIHKPARDFVDIAERLIGVPYLWGGKTRLGLDCSGLVQISLDAAGIKAPRDSDMQEAELGAPVLVPESLNGLARGDLVFWRGHVGVMADGIMLVHANGHHMATVIEPLAEAAQRIARDGSRITAIKRLPSLSAFGQPASAM